MKIGLAATHIISIKLVPNIAQNADVVGEEKEMDINASVSSVILNILVQIVLIVAGNQRAPL